MMIAPALTQVNAQITPRYSEVYATDSMSISYPALSPDERWIAFSAGSQTGNGRLLYVVPSSGGTPVAITHGIANDNQPLWFPKGDAILFHSSRTKNGLMTLRVDPQTGRAIGEPVRLTVERTGIGAFAISPDGRHVAIGPRPVGNHTEIKILPAEGGATRVVTGVDGTVTQIYWRDDNTLEYMFAAGARVNLMRVSVSGGQPQLVTNYDQTKGFALIGPQYTFRGALLRIRADTLGAIAVISRSGDTVAHFDSHGTRVAGGLGNNLRPTSNPEVVLLASALPRGSMRLGALGADGSPRVLGKDSDDSNTEMPVGFSPDSKSLYVVTSHGANTSLEIASMNGGARRTIALGQGPREVYPTTTGRYAYVWLGHVSDTSRTLQLLDLATGTTQNITEHARFELSRQPRGSDDLLFAETNGAQIDIRRFVPGKGSTLIASLDTAGLELHRFHVEGLSLGGVAYARAKGDSARLYVQRGSSPHLIATVRGSINYVALSPDGHGLFFGTIARDGKSSRPTGQLVELDDNLEPRGAPRAVVTNVIGLDGSAWSPDGKTLVVGASTHSRSDTVATVDFISRANSSIIRAVELPHPADNREAPFVWSKDNKHVFVLMADLPAESRMDVWRVGATEGEPPMSFVSREKNTFWDYVLSPDEKTIAYEAYLPSRNSIWKVTLPGLARTKR